MTASEGYPVWNATYGPCGEEHAPQATVNHYKFTGKERDAESGLDYFGARFSASSIGRFVTPDIPLIDQRSIEPQSWNLYTYVRNNPITFVDPNGMECVKTDEGRPADDGKGSTCKAVADDDKKEHPNVIVEDKISSVVRRSADEQRIFNLASDINRRNILENTAKLYGASVIVGVTGGTACYYLCPAAAGTTLGLAGASGAAGAGGAAAESALAFELVSTLTTFIAEGHAALAWRVCIELTRTPAGRALLAAAAEIVRKLIASGPPPRDPKDFAVIQTLLEMTHKFPR